MLIKSSQMLPRQEINVLFLKAWTFSAIDAPKSKNLWCLHATWDSEAASLALRNYLKSCSRDHRGSSLSLPHSWTPATDCKMRPSWLIACSQGSSWSAQNSALLSSTSQQWLLPYTSREAAVTCNLKHLNKL